MGKSISLRNAPYLVPCTSKITIATYICTKFGDDNWIEIKKIMRFYRKYYRFYGTHIAKHQTIHSEALYIHQTFTNCAPSKK